jgi:hypothetical protein
MFFWGRRGEQARNVMLLAAGAKATNGGNNNRFVPPNNARNVPNKATIETSQGMAA